MVEVRKSHYLFRSICSTKTVNLLKERRLSQHISLGRLRLWQTDVKVYGRLFCWYEIIVWQRRDGKKHCANDRLLSEACCSRDSTNSYLFVSYHRIIDIGLVGFVGDSTTKYEIWSHKRKPEDTWTLRCSNKDVKNEIHGKCLRLFVLYWECDHFNFGFDL